MTAETEKKIMSVIEGVKQNVFDIFSEFSSGPMHQWDSQELRGLTLELQRVKR